MPFFYGGNMKKIIKKIIFGSSILSTALFMCILIPCLMVMDFFGANIGGGADMDGAVITDDYVINNKEYAIQYKKVLNDKIKQGLGYVPLSRLVYFNQSNRFYSELYDDNINKINNKLLSVDEVCALPKYSYLANCKPWEINRSNQLRIVQAKPFVKPIDFNKASITSFFMEERIIFGEKNIHSGWDFGAENNTSVFAVCEGEVINVSFREYNNKTNKFAGGGNTIDISCNILGINYIVTYAHLFPYSNLVYKGDKVIAGQQLAEVGTTGYSTGPHLHFQVTINGKNVDGMSLINFQKEE